MNAGIDPGGELGGWDYYGDEIGVFEALGAPAYESYDPFSGMTPSFYTGGYAQNFPVEAFEPDPYYQPPVQGPLEDIYDWGKGVISSKTAQEALWGWIGKETGLGTEERAIQEGAGVTIVHTQPAQAGGAPAQPYSYMIPGVPAPPQAPKLSATVLIGAGLVVLYFLLK